MIKKITRFVFTMSILTFVFLAIEFFLYSLLSLNSWLFYPILIILFIVLGVVVNLLSSLRWYSKITSSLIVLGTVFLGLVFLKVILMII